MSTADFVVQAQARDNKGSSAARRLRNTGRVPCIIYGGNQEPAQVSVDHDELMHKLEQEAFYSHILTVDVDGKKEQALLRDVQRHPSRMRVLHVDFQRVSATDKIHVQVPLHFVGEEAAPGVKIGGGLVSHLMTSIDVRCLPRDLPEFIEVDLSALELNESVHLSDLKLPSGLEIVELSHGSDHDLPVASIHGRGGPAAEAGEEGEAEGGEEGGE